MALKVHHVSAIHGPQLHSLIIRYRCEAVHLWHLAEATNDVIVGQKLFLLSAVVPQANLLVLAACDCHTVW